MHGNRLYGKKCNFSKGMTVTMYVCNIMHYKSANGICSLSDFVLVFMSENGYILYLGGGGG